MNLEKVSVENDHPTTVGCAYPRLVDRMPSALRELDLAMARHSQSWDEIVDALVAQMFDLSTVSFGSMFPILAEWVTIDFTDEGMYRYLGIVPLSTRARNVFRQNHIDTWSDLEGLSLETLFGFDRAGIKAVRDAGRVVVELVAAASLGLFSLEASHLAPYTPTKVDNEIFARPRTWIDDRPMQMLATWGQLIGKAHTLGDVLDLLEENGSATADIIESLAALRSTPLSDILTEEPPTFADLIGSFIEEFTDAEKVVLRCRVLTDAPLTLEKVGMDLGVTRERVRQIQTRLESLLDCILASDGYAGIHWIAHFIRRTLGTFAPAEAVASCLDSITAELNSEDAILGQVLLLRLAGPYRMERGRLLSESMDGISTILHDCVDEYGIIARSTFFEVLKRAGILPMFHNAAIEWLGYRQFGDRLVAWPSNGVDKVVATLALRGSPADIETLIAELGDEYNARSIQGRLPEDPRLVRVSRRDWGLVAWGLEEYSGIVEEIIERIERGNGTVRLDEVVAEVSSFGVSERSVRLYAEAPMFVTENGWLRLRKPSEIESAIDGIDGARGTFRLGDSRIAFVVEVDHEVLRGSGRPIPRGTAVALGVQPGDKLAYTGEIGEVVISWPLSSITGPTIGSLRNHAVGNDLDVGDYLRFEFDIATRGVTSNGVKRGTLPLLEPSDAIGALTGLTFLPGINPASVLATSLDVPITSVRRVLTSRHDDFLLEFLPVDTVGPELQDALSKLTTVLRS